MKDCRSLVLRGLWLLLPAAVWFAGTDRLCTAAEDDEGDLAQYYGFDRLELFKLHQRSQNMLAADLNSDGRTDLILIDNSNSRLDLLVQRDPAAAGSTAARPRARANDIPNDKRLEHKKVPTDREVVALAVGDFNGDGRKDLAYFAVPDQLNVVYQSKTGDWTDRRKIRAADVAPQQWILAAGDMNHDGKDDLVLLGKHDTYLVYQQPDGTLAPLKRLMNTSEKLGLVQIVDLDGDGRNDLCYLTSAEGDDRPLCVRLQRPNGQLGPELRCELPRYRGVTYADLDGKPGQEILAIEAQTGRVNAYKLQRPELQPGDPAGQLIQFGFGQQSSGKNRDLATGDVDGDGRIDVVVTDPEGAQVIVFLQQPDTGLDLGTSFPGLVGTEQVRVGNIDADPQAEVLLLSAKEKTIGLSRMRDGRLTFPEGVPLEKEPICLELTDLNGDGRRELIVVARERTGQSSKYFLQALSRGEQSWQPFRLGAVDSVPLSLKGTPTRLVALDANRDAKTDFLIFTGDTDKPPMFLLADGQGTPTEVPAADGGFGLGNASAGGLFLGMLDQPVVLVAQSNFARSVGVTDKKQWQVLDQYNAAEAEAKIVGVATIDLDGQPGREIVLVDQGVRKLRILRKDGTIFGPWREVDIGAFPYKSTHVADLDGDGREDLLLFGGGKFGVLYAGRTDPRLKAISSYETKQEKVHFLDLTAGDVNSDGQPDVVVIDTQSQFVDILNFTPTAGLKHALQFKVFEAKSLVGEERTGNEPREVLVADVTGDGRPDLVILSHDRVLVYPQEAPAKAPETAGAAAK